MGDYADFGALFVTLGEKCGVASMGAQRPQAATRARDGLAGACAGASSAGVAVVVVVLRPFWPKNGEQL